MNGGIAEITPANGLIEGCETGRLWDNEQSEAARSWSSVRPLAHLIDSTDRQDAVKAINPPLPVHATVSAQQTATKQEPICGPDGLGVATPPQNPLNGSEALSSDVAGAVRAICSIGDCERGGRLKRGWCSMHYSRWRKFGDPMMLESSRELTPDDVFFRMVADARPGGQACIGGCTELGRPNLCTRCLHRFWSKVTADDNGCWRWTGTVIDSGYGMFAVRSANQLAHRLAYEQLVGRIPDGLVIDHRCHTDDAICDGGICPHRRCCNPGHLEPVTQIVNVARGHGLAATTRRTGVCGRGHAITGDNVYVAPGDPTRRRCRECRTTKGLAA